MTLRFERCVGGYGEMLLGFARSVRGLGMLVLEVHCILREKLLIVYDGQNGFVVVVAAVVDILLRVLHSMEEGMCYVSRYWLTNQLLEETHDTSNDYFGL